MQDHVLIRLNNSTEFMRDAYRSATIMTLPSLVESFGIALLEALAARLPVVAHNGTGLPCIIDDDITGRVVDVRDTEQYIAALLALLGDDVERARMGEAGRQQALTRFSLETVAEHLFAVYAELLSFRSASSSILVSSSGSSKPSVPAASLEESIGSKS